MLVESLEVKLDADTSNLEKGFMRAAAKLGLLVKAFEAVADFAVESVKEFAAQEEANTRLAVAAGKSTEALIRQADAIEKSLGVDDKKVKQMQTLLATFGQAPADIDRTVRAVLDYADRTGKDAVGATEQLIRGVEAGTGELSRMGINFDETGNKATDLGRATDALAGKFGGAAAANAQTLAGQVRVLGGYWDDLKEAFGGFIMQVEAKVGVLHKLGAALKAVIEYLNEGQQRADRDKLAAAIDERDSLKASLAKFQGLDAGGKAQLFNQIGADTTGTQTGPGDWAARVKELDATIKGFMQQNLAAGAGLSTESDFTEGTKKTRGAGDAVSAGKQLEDAFLMNAHAIGDEMRAREDMIGDEVDMLEFLNKHTEKLADSFNAAGMASRKLAKDAKSGALGGSIAPTPPRASTATEMFNEFLRQVGLAAAGLDAMGKPLGGIAGTLKQFGANLLIATAGLTSKLGRMGQVIQAAIQGAQQGGWIGAIVAVIMTLLSMTKAWEKINAVSELMTSQILVAFDEGLGPLVEGFSSVVSGLNYILIPIFRVVGKAFGAIGKILEPFGPLLALLGMTLAPIFEIIGRLVVVFGDVIGGVLTWIFRILFDIGKGLLQVALTIGRTIGEIWNWIINALADILNAIVSAISFGAVTDAGEWIRGALISFKEFDEFAAGVAASNFDDMIKASRELGDAHHDAAGAVKGFTESLTNVPAGFKVAAARFNATAATGGASSMATAAAGAAGVTVQVFVDSTQVAAKVRKISSRATFIATGGIAESGSEGDSASSGTSGRWGER